MPRLEVAPVSPPQVESHPSAAGRVSAEREIEREFLNDKEAQESLVHLLRDDCEALPDEQDTTRPKSQPDLGGPRVTPPASGSSRRTPPATTTAAAVAADLRDQLGQRGARFAQLAEAVQTMDNASQDFASLAKDLRKREQAKSRRWGL